MVAPIMPEFNFPSTILQFKTKTTRSIGRVDLFLPDKRVSRSMLRMASDEAGQLSVEVLGMNTCYVRLAGTSTLQIMHKHTNYLLSHGSRIYLLPGAVYVLEVYHTSRWQAQNIEKNVDHVREAGERIATVRARRHVQSGPKPPPDPSTMHPKLPPIVVDHHGMLSFFFFFPAHDINFKHTHRQPN